MKNYHVCKNLWKQQQVFDMGEADMHGWSNEHKLMVFAKHPLSTFWMLGEEEPSLK